MDYKIILICIAAVAAAVILVRIIAALIRSGTLQRLWRRIKVTRGWRIFRRVMAVFLFIAVLFVIGYFIYTGCNL